VRASLRREVGIHKTPRSRLVDYSVAVLATAFSLLIRWLLWPGLGDVVPHMTFFPAVMIAAYFGGFWPGLLATILSAMAANYFLTGQLRAFHITSVNDVAAVILFVLVGAIISALSEFLHRTQRRFRDLVNSVEGIVWEADAATFQFSFVSKQAERILGYPVERWLSEPGFWKNHLHPEDRDWAAELCVKATAEKRDHDFEYRMIAADGSAVWLRDIVTVEVEGDHATRVRGVMVDITKRKQAEEAVRQARMDLAHVSRVTTMGELTASLAHEIKQPITAAVTNAKTCLRWLARDKPDIPEARAAVSRIVQDVTRAADTISRIRSIFEKGTSQGESVDINEIIREMIVLLRNEAARYSISIRTDLATDLPNVIADRVQLQQVFMNLMLNGIDAMKDMNPAGALTIKSQQTKNGELLIAVSDTGAGVPPEQAEQIFNAFFTTKEHGTGMGLPISRSIIESHGGRLWASANSGRGATFQFTLPSQVEARK
jgi:PAS domain S-box-containing protein